MQAEGLGGVVRLTHTLLKGALTQAVKWQMIARNPAEYAACRSAGSENSSLRKKVCTMGDVGERMLAELRRSREAANRRVAARLRPGGDRRAGRARSRTAC